MKKSNSQTLEVLEPEVEEIPLEKKIDQALIKVNVTEKVIAALKDNYGNMKLKSIDDKESYLDIVNARKIVRKVGIITEQECKKGRESAIKEQKLWLAKEKEILGKVGEVQNPLDEEIKRFEDEVERKELEERKRQEGTYINRQTTLAKLGATYDNGNFVLNHISYEVELLKQADNDLWNDTILPKYKKVYEENQTALVEEENKRKLQLEAEKKQREEFELQQAEFKKEQELFAKQQAELKKQMDDAEREKRLAQERIEAEERIKKQSRITNRYDQLFSLGMKHSGQYDAYVFEDVNVDNKTEINLFNDKEWDALIQAITPAIEERKKAAAEKLIEEGKKKEEAAIQKALEEAELKKQQEEQRKAEELAKAGDKAKFQHFIGQVQALQIPPMSSGLYRNKIQMAKEKIEEIINL